MYSSMRGTSKCLDIEEIIVGMMKRFSIEVDFIRKSNVIKGRKWEVGRAAVATSSDSNSDPKKLLMRS